MAHRQTDCVYVRLASCLLGNFAYFLSSADFFKINFAKNSFRNTIRVADSLDPGLSGLVGAKTVCKGSQRTTLVDKQLVLDI